VDCGSTAAFLFAAIQAQLVILSYPKNQTALQHVINYVSLLALSSTSLARPLV